MRDADCGHPHTHVGFVHWILEAALSPHIAVSERVDSALQQEVTFETRSPHTGLEQNLGLKQNPPSKIITQLHYVKWAPSLPEAIIVFDDGEFAFNSRLVQNHCGYAFSSRKEGGKDRKTAHSLNEDFFFS